MAHVLKVLLLAAAACELCSAEDETVLLQVGQTVHLGSQQLEERPLEEHEALGEKKAAQATSKAKAEPLSLLELETEKTEKAEQMPPPPAMYGEPMDAPYAQPMQPPMQMMGMPPSEMQPMQPYGEPMDAPYAQPMQPPMQMMGMPPSEMQPMQPPMMPPQYGMQPMQPPMMPPQMDMQPMQPPMDMQPPMEQYQYQYQQPMQPPMDMQPPMEPYPVDFSEEQATEEMQDESVPWRSHRRRMSGWPGWWGDNFDYAWNRRWGREYPWGYSPWGGLGPGCAKCLAGGPMFDNSWVKANCFQSCRSNHLGMAVHQRNVGRAVGWYDTRPHPFA
jgi:hypothetical protein